ncbi:hypothetical protein TPHA_0A02670 [Tetrapisispora phaffii CBS 4417]|uniref:ATP synthase mitochondrial F1 complex assembly factor 2 n=1 Tax=Tetrapisispora phaffii (strain ATCC 24235 / CBS 4417 / NBRC 1672 / NRRL Y-8282 / UCD 70-5) TaxID=1071381 RepID=G8BN71_TETPH|nr:hypothetical protein TPHA_0A02670 [Tetrapisispora phaffii CBS 4417]CCE61349.1 hypothetical protein TPHA_0A02670 [Tetrapisispora phaffii CBS 4417]
MLTKSRPLIRNVLKNLGSLRYLSCTSHIGSSVPLGIDTTLENNTVTETNRLSKTLTKFWDKVSIKNDLINNNILIQLDGRTINTPLGNKLAVDSSRKMLAYLLMNEWKNLPSLSIRQYSLPLTSLVSRCIDLEKLHLEGDADAIEKYNGNLEKMISDTLRYLDTDTLLIFSPRKEFEGKLREEQDKLYLPIIEQIERFLSKLSKKSIKLNVLDSDLHGLRGNQQDKDTREAAANYLRSLSYWDLAIFEKVVLTTKSFICGILVILNKTNGSSELGISHTTEDIIRYSTLETIFQTERWGEVEDTHDVNKRDIFRNITAASIVAFKE